MGQNVVRLLPGSSARIFYCNFWLANITLEPFGCSAVSIPSAAFWQLLIQRQCFISTGADSVPLVCEE